MIDMNKECVLILGNGISRLLFDKEIREFKGEIWGCNRIYLDYGDILTLLYGHPDVVREGGFYRDKNHLHYKLAGTNEFYLKCNKLFRKDSGTTLVAEALTRGYRIILCGFDLGGPDVYSPGLEKRNKSIWVVRWRLIYKKFGKNNIEWWGTDHSKFILSNEDKKDYAHRYMIGLPHIKDIGYRKLLANWKQEDVMERIDCVFLHNIGNREWTLPEFYDIKIDTNDKIKMPKCVAEKYKQKYPRDFEILPLTE